MYTPETVQVEHKGFQGELMGCMEREIKTFFDLDNAPFSNMVLGEVLNRPASGPPIRPTIIPSRRSISTGSTILDGFGAGFANGEILQDRAQRLRRHQPRLPLSDGRARLRHVLRLGHPASGGRSLGQDPHRRSGARLAVEGRCQRPHLSQSLTGGNKPHENRSFDHGAGSGPFP